MIQPAPAPKFTLAPDTAARLAELQSRVPAAVSAAEAIKVTDDQTEERAIVARKILKGHESAAEKSRTTEVQPYNAFVKEVNAAFGKITNAIDKAVSYIDGQLLAWRREKQRRVDEENRKREAERVRLETEAAEKAAAEAKAAGNFTPAETQEYAAAAAQEVIAPLPVLEPAKTTRTDFGAASYPQVLDFEVLNPSVLIAALPQAYELKRGAVLAYGRTSEKPEETQPLHGVRFFKRDSVSGR